MRRLGGGRQNRRRVGIDARVVACAGALAFAVAACGEGGSTEVGSPPTALVPISAAVDTVVAGEVTDPPIAVRVEDALGNPVEGTPVRFIIVEGEGDLSPGVAVSGRDGIAESVYRAGPTPGEAEVQADIPSAAGVPPLRFVVLAGTADTVTLLAVEGDMQRAEAGSQLSHPFTVRAVTATGAPAGGVRIAFRVAPQVEDFPAEPPAITADTLDELAGPPAGGEPAPQQAGEGPPRGDGATDDPFGGELPPSDGAEEAAPDPGGLTHEDVVTGADGLSRSVFTLGGRPGDYRVLVFATGGVHSDTLTLTATALAAAGGVVALDSIGGGQLSAGRRATLIGRGFSPVPADNEVRIEGVAATVVSATDTELEIEVPIFGDSCRPQRPVGVRVLVGGEASNGLMPPMEPADRLIDLDVGEAVTLRGPVDIECVHFAPAEAERAFDLLVANTGRTGARALPLRLTTRTAADLSGGGPATELAAPDIDPALQRSALAGWRTDMGVRDRTLRGLLESQVAPYRAPDPPGPLNVPAAGDTLEFLFPVRAELAGVCTQLNRAVPGAVRAVGARVVLVEDVSAPPGGASEDEWGDLAARLDRVVMPVAASWFGPPPDIDRNGRVIVLFTPEVNRLGDGEAGISGFSLPLDLAASGRDGDIPDGAGRPCPASNEGEIIYSASADPEGTLGRAVTAEDLLRETPALVAHELQHITSVGRRALNSPAGFGAAEEAWLDEALSKLSEEVTGLALLGQPAGENLAFDALSDAPAGREVFDVHLRDNFVNLGLYLLATGEAPTISTEDVDGLAGRQMRGFGWFLMRWLADRQDGDERAFFRSIVGGGRNFARGIGNLERVTGVEWAELLAEASVAMAVDDVWADERAEGAGDEAARQAPPHQLATWNVRDVFRSMSQDANEPLAFRSGFPLGSRPLGYETRALTLDVGPSNVYYFSLSSEEGAPALSLSVRTGAAAAPDDTAEPMITIVRTR